MRLLSIANSSASQFFRRVPPKTGFFRIGPAQTRTQCQSNSWSMQQTTRSRPLSPLPLPVGCLCMRGDSTRRHLIKIHVYVSRGRVDSRHQCEAGA